jgi:hypothetical protein
VTWAGQVPVLILTSCCVCVQGRAGHMRASCRPLCSSGDQSKTVNCRVLVLIWAPQSSCENLTSDRQSSQCLVIRPGSVGCVGDDRRQAGNVHIWA